MLAPDVLGSDAQIAAAHALRHLAEGNGANKERILAEGAAVAAASMRANSRGGSQGRDAAIQLLQQLDSISPAVPVDNDMV